MRKLYKTPRFYDSLLVQIFQKLGHTVLVHKDEEQTYQFPEMPKEVLVRGALMFIDQKAKLDNRLRRAYLEHLRDNGLYAESCKNKLCAECKTRCLL